MASRTSTAPGAEKLVAVAVLTAAVAREMVVARAVMEVVPMVDGEEAVREAAAQVGTREMVGEMSLAVGVVRVREKADQVGTRKIAVWAVMVVGVVRVLVTMGIASVVAWKAAVTREVGEAVERVGENSSSSDPLPSLFFRSEAWS